MANKPNGGSVPGPSEPEPIRIRIRIRAGEGVFSCEQMRALAALLAVTPRWDD